MKEKLLEIYRKLYRAFGPQYWWPADSDFEVAVGAILTQNTSWSNVEKAIKNLKNSGCLSFQGDAALERKETRAIDKAGRLLQYQGQASEKFLWVSREKLQGTFRTDEVKGYFSFEGGIALCLRHRP